MKRERGHLSAGSPGCEKHDAGGSPFNDFLGKSFEEKPIWTGLYESLHDAMFPPRLPALELTSIPIPIPDRMAVKANPWAFGTATIVNGGILAIVLLMGLGSTIDHLRKPLPGEDIHLKDFTLFAPASAQSLHGGGSGGSNELTDPITGRAPKQEDIPLTPPQVPLVENPILRIDPSIAVPPEVKLPDNPALPNIGVQKSPNVSLASNGQGSHAGIGTGPGGGDGPGKGPGYGPGFNGGFGGSFYTPGIGGVSHPVPIVTPEAEFSDEARRNKYQGACLISIIVDARGYPQSPRVIQSLGMGLDEKALEAVQKYRFKPALKDGKPVAARIIVEVNFRLY
ncbi:MAG: energy transducer TonB [Terracidiphilus sp.]|jgi:TonB family protein